MITDFVIFYLFLFFRANEFHLDIIIYLVIDYVYNIYICVHVIIDLTFYNNNLVRKLL